MSNFHFRAIFARPLLGNENPDGRNSDEILYAKFLKPCKLTLNQISANSETSTYLKCPAILDPYVQRLLNHVQIT